MTTVCTAATTYVVNYMCTAARGRRLCTPALDQRWGICLLSRAAWSVHYLWRAAKSIYFILKFYLYQKEWLLMTYYLSTCLSRSFVLTRWCTLTWVTKIMLRAISNVHAGRIGPAARRFPTPALGPLPIQYSERKAWSQLFAKFCRHTYYACSKTRLKRTDFKKSLWYL